MQIGEILRVTPSSPLSLLSPLRIFASNLLLANEFVCSEPAICYISVMSQPDDIFKKAQQRDRAIDQQVKALLAEKDELTSFMRKYSELQSQAFLDLEITEPNYTSAKDEILTNCARILAKRSLPTKFLIEELRKRGVDVGGKSEKNKLLNLSALLSRDERFKSGDRKTGWSVIK